MSDKILNIKEASQLLNIHWQTVRNYINSGKLPASKIGKNIRIRESDVIRLLNGTSSESENVEIELRFLTEKRTQIEEKLLKMGAKVSYHALVIDHWYIPNEIKNLEEKNEYFDTGKGFGLRIREQDNDYVGKMNTSLEVKRLVTPFQHDTCIEQEIPVTSYDETDRLLRLMNFKEFITIEKDRLIYKLKDIKVVIDDIKNFATGVEIEIMTNKGRDFAIPIIKNLAEELGLDLANELTEKSVTYEAMVKLAIF